jgi:hypothetical protein
MNEDKEYYMYLYTAYHDKKYLCDIDNIIKIYIRFCEFLETMDYDKKRKLISKLDYSTFFCTNEKNEEFVDFLREYVNENPDLEIYREEIISMRYDPNMFYEGVHIFNNTNNVSYLK